MRTDRQEGEHDAVHHVRHVAQMLETVLSHVQGDLGKIDDPKVTALFQSAADVLLKLKAAFDEFGNGWRPEAHPEAQTRPTDSPPQGTRPPSHATEVRSADADTAPPTAEAIHARKTPPAPELAGFEE